MSLIVRTHAGRQYLAGTPGAPLLGRPEDATLVIEECFAHGVNDVLLWPAQLSPQFFDLSSGEAGAILQKLRNYRIRLAIVVPPGTPVSRRFAELMADEQQSDHFRMFAEEAPAAAWLCRDG